MIVTLHVLALILYGAATVLAVAPFVGGRPAPRGLLLGVPSAGAAFHVAALAQLPLVGLAPAVSMLALCFVILQVLSERTLRASAVALFTGPLAAGLTIHSPLDDARRTGFVAVDFPRSESASRVLIEERLEGPRLGTMDVYQIAAEGADRAKGLFEAIAYVDVNARGGQMKFAETVAVNRGLPVTVFASVDDAREWLLKMDSAR